MRGQWDAALYKQLLGAANEFKEGDAIIGVAAVDDDARRRLAICSLPPRSMRSISIRLFATICSNCGWCIDQIMPANPGYLMALPTRIDPMLGYLTTGYQDHVHIREKFGFKVNDRMWQFFQQLGVIDDRDSRRNISAIRLGVSAVLSSRKMMPDRTRKSSPTAAAQIADVRSRGVFIAEGFGEQPSMLEPSLAKHIQHIYDDAKISIWMQLDDAFVATVPNVKRLRTRSADRTDYILHPVSGEHLSDESVGLIARFRRDRKEQFNAQIVISDGLNALAVMDGDQLLNLIRRLRQNWPERSSCCLRKI